MGFELLVDAAKMALLVAAVYLAIDLGTRRWRPAWSTHLVERRTAVLILLLLTVTAIRVSEDVVGQPSGPIDEAILLWLHKHVPTALVPFFRAITFNGSAKVLLPLAGLATIALLAAKRRREAVLLGASAASAPALVYLLKTAVGRVRPALWETQWYWGSSFPSGHTLSNAAVATAAALCVGRLWPRRRAVAMAVALSWLTLVGMSRLVLGVHWPSDVLTAACLGAMIPLVIDMVFGFRGGVVAPVALPTGSEGSTLESLRRWARQVKRDAVALWFACRHPDTPWPVKGLCVFVVAYALSPIDLIPDFIPVLGYVDEVLLLPGLIWLAVRLMPGPVLATSRAEADRWMAENGSKPRSYAGAALVVAVWLLFAYLGWRWYEG